MTKHPTVTRFFLTFAVIACISGCITTHIKGFTDQDFQSYRLKKISVRALNSNFMFGEILERSMVERLRGKGLQAEPFTKMFPPTRKWTNEQVAAELTKQGYDTIMYINLVESGSSSQTVGYVNTGNASAYGNLTTFNGMSVPITTRSRHTSTRITIFDVVTARTIWIGDTATRAGGLAFVGDTTQTEDIAREVTETLVGSGHIKEN
jgi:hypothetical protein